jgi:hypothetical protein
VETRVLVSQEQEEFQAWAEQEVQVPAAKTLQEQSESHQKKWKQ